MNSQTLAPLSRVTGGWARASVSVSGQGLIRSGPFFAARLAQTRSIGKNFGSAQQDVQGMMMRAALSRGPSAAAMMLVPPEWSIP